jgi:hypothetical protein
MAHLKQVQVGTWYFVIGKHTLDIILVAMKYLVTQNHTLQHEYLIDDEHQVAIKYST